MPTTTTTGDDGLDPMATVVHDQIRELVDRLALCDSRMRRGESDGVHKMRVTLRRLRSLLATFGPLYDQAVVDALRAELAWLAGEFGTARDTEVVRSRLRTMATTEEQRDVAARVDVELAEIEVGAREQAVAALDSERHSDLLRELTAFVTDPPWAPETNHSVDELVPRRVLREWKRLRKRVVAVDEAEDDVRRRQALHEVRKAVKRLRYAAVTLKPAYGSNAKRLADRAKQMQTILGGIQDQAVAREMLRAQAARPGRDAHDAFVLGTFYADEDSDWAEAEEQQYAEAWSALSKKKNRRWLS